MLVDVCVCTSWCHSCEAASTAWLLNPHDTPTCQS